MSAFSNFSSSYGQFWYGGGSLKFPGFLYKKTLGAGSTRSTKMNPGGNTICNKSTYLYNKYKPGTGGVGASSISNRRAKNRLATVSSKNDPHCFSCYTTLGRYPSFNGFIPCPVVNIANKK